jgi:hypothetical protein
MDSEGRFSIAPDALCSRLAVTAETPFELPGAEPFAHVGALCSFDALTKGAYAAAVGTILGACVPLGKVAIGDWLTALVALASLGILFRFKVSNPLLVGAAAGIGLIAFLLLQPAWVFVK